MATVIHWTHPHHTPDGAPSQVLEDPHIPYGNLSKDARKRFANLMMDSAFKIVFGLPASEKTLIGLLETLIPGKKIRSIKYLDKEIPGFFLEDQKTVFDLYCESEDRERFIIEMQLNPQKNFRERVLFYSTFPLREQLLKPVEEQYLRNSGASRKIQSYHLVPVYVISILNFKLKHQKEASLRDGLLSSYSIRSDQDGELMTDALHFLFLELPRLKYKKDEAFRCKTMLEKIAFVFRHSSFLEDRPVELSGELFERIFHAAEVANMTAEEFLAYQSEMLASFDQMAQREYAREEAFKDGREEGWEVGLDEGRKEGRKEGREEGRKEGREEGRKEGLEEGRKEAREEIIRKLVQQGIPVEKIQDIL